MPYVVYLQIPLVCSLPRLCQSRLWQFRLCSQCGCVSVVMIEAVSVTPSFKLVATPPIHLVIAVPRVRFPERLRRTRETWGNCHQRTDQRCSFRFALPSSLDVYVPVTWVGNPVQSKGCCYAIMWIYLGRKGLAARP